jgi:hypothetical protein
VKWNDDRDDAVKMESPQPEQPTLSERIEAIVAVLASVDIVLERLTERLAPVLLPEEAMGDKPYAIEPSAAQSPMAVWLTEVLLRVERLHARMWNLHGRVEQ